MKTMTGQFYEVHDWLTIQLAQAPDVWVGEWQAQKNVPQEATIELEDVSFEVAMPGYSDAPNLRWQLETMPNLPWAEDHFQERVSGIPHNPPPSHEWWPYAQASNEAFTSDRKFSHTYPERMWPRSLMPDGIRHPTGDLSSLVQLLESRPGTRQGYLPIWFPEDLEMANNGERVPCTLGYHFLIRDNQLKIVYYIRSCDFYRHFRDDVYMAGRLAQWVGEQVNVPATKLVMHISSLHIFSTERGKAQAEAKEIITKNMMKVR